jgi:hypothetical protein
MRRRTKMTWWATKRHSPRILAMLTTRVDERRSTKLAPKAQHLWPFRCLA